MSKKKKIEVTDFKEISNLKFNETMDQICVTNSEIFISHANQISVWTIEQEKIEFLKTITSKQHQNNITIMKKFNTKFGEHIWTFSQFEGDFYFLKFFIF